jgi:branched-chain amino acid aminotransferase
MLLHSYINGNYYSAEKSVIPVSDLGLLRSYAVFDYLRTYNKKPFRLDDYISRFAHSAIALNLVIPVAKNKLKEIVSVLCDKAQTNEDIGIRFLITGGVASDGISLSSPNFMVLAETLTSPSGEKFTNGVKLMTDVYLREMPEVKTTNYRNAILKQEAKINSGAYEMLYVYDNKVLETTRNNIFFFLGDTLITPEKNILKGVTRKVVIELTEGLFKTERRDVAIEEMKEATECFITGTTKKILPVVQIDEIYIGNGKPGPNTRLLMERFEKVVAMI